MTTIQRLFLGREASAFEQGHSLHGRWRVAYQRAAAPDEERTPAALAIAQDAARLVFVLAEGPAAALLVEKLADRLWTLEKIGDDWPAPLVAWLGDAALWPDAPAGPACLAVGRLDRQQPVGAIALAWLGCAGVRLLDRALLQVEAEHPPAAGGAWSPEGDIPPDPAALGWQRGSLFGLDRLVVVSNGAAPLAADLPDMATADVRQALLDWSAEATRDLALLDLHLAPVVSQPSAVALTYRWVAPELCELRWNPSPSATAYRLEASAAPDFASPTLLAELTDGRQIVYRFSPPPGRITYYRVVPLNQGVAGPPSEVVCPLPPAMTAPVLLPPGWSAEGGPALRWTPLPQATGYEVQESIGEHFESGETTIVYRGEHPDCELPPETPAGRFYRARALNTLYAPETPSPWSAPAQAPTHLDTPIFTRVTSERLAWTPVPGARAYVLHITPQGQDEGQGEDITITEPSSAVAHVHATYRARALRGPGDTRSASEWSAPATVAPPGAAGSSPSNSRPVGPLIVGVALVALFVGAALGLGGLRAYQDANATATPNVTATREAVRAAFAADLTATADAFTATPSPTLTASPTRTPIPSATPDSAATREAARAAFAADLTATADAFTATPSPTLTASPTRTPVPSATPDSAATHEAVRAAFAADLTATADAFTATPSPTLTASPTRTPVPSATPDSAATREAVRAAFAADLTATAAAFTATPSPTLTASPTRTPIPSATPDSAATHEAVRAAFAADLTATAAAFTATPSPTLTASPTRTPVPSATPDSAATAAALLVTALDAEACLLVNLDDLPLPVLSRPFQGAEQIAAQAPRLTRVVGQVMLSGEDGGQALWLRVALGAGAGWVRVPPSADLARLVAGPGCPTR
ncbi:MAG: hypothetical protein M5U29_09420 [Anaerolineae bacterium]|nr:hypothetical protein [Anaerolineae bacterium]